MAEEQPPLVSRAIVELEGRLGDPHQLDGLFSFAQAVELDEREAYPEEACAELDRLGLQRHYVPRSVGGDLDSYEETLGLLRLVGRRDLTTAVTHAVTMPGASLVWFAGNDDQRRRLAEIVLAGGRVCIAFHEKEHGNDLLSCEFAAVPEANGFRLNGEKWGISHAQRSAALVLLARTANESGPRGFSLFLLDKTTLPKATLSYLPRLKTHGARGQEIDGIRISDCLIPRESLIGKEGEALELALKCSQITRTLSLGPLLGAADTALRATVAHTLERRLYGEPALEIPAVKISLAGAFADLLTAECVALSATRAIQAAPQRLSTWAPAAKYFVTTRVERTLHELSVVLGSRFFLRHVHWHGIFQKILRDAPMTRVSHFSGVISLSHLAGQLPTVYRRHKEINRDELEQRFRPVFALGAPLPAISPERFALAAHGSDEMLSALSYAREVVIDLGVDSGVDSGVRTRLLSSIDRLSNHSLHLRAFLADLSPATTSGARSAELLQAAQHHALLHAAAAASLVWAYNRKRMEPFFAGAAWLSLALERLSAELSPVLAAGAWADAPRVADGLGERQRQNRLFSVTPVELGLGAMDMMCDD